MASNSHRRSLQIETRVIGGHISRRFKALFVEQASAWRGPEGKYAD